MSASPDRRRSQRDTVAAAARAEGPIAADPAQRAVCLVSLGCSKNLVDTEVMAGHLGRAGLDLVFDPGEADLVIVNTCGFIDEARAESEATIAPFAEARRRGTLAGLVVTGCMVELHEARLRQRFPEVDALLPISDYSGVPSIVDAVLGGRPAEICPTGTDPARGSTPPRRAARAASVSGQRYATETIELPGGQAKRGDSDLGRALLTARHTAYLRLGEGCNHVCAFCAIPKIRGKLKSKPLAVLVEEARALVAIGARELSLVAEDSTDWGKDLPGGERLADLLSALAEIEELPWLRVLYAHPATIDSRLIETLASAGNVLPYLDLPIQHGDDALLRAMRRGTDSRRITEVVSALRDAVPDITLRTTILVGFPGETEAAFARLLERLSELAFDRVGCFTWSPEEGTEAARLPGRVPPGLAAERRAIVMDLQRKLLRRSNRARVGSTDIVLVDAVERDAHGAGLALGRTLRDAPEIDGRVLVELPAARTASRGAARPARRSRATVAVARDRRVRPADPQRVSPGDFLVVTIRGAKGYDLLAAPA